jgi:hypothetical protein
MRRLLLAGCLLLQLAPFCWAPTQPQADELRNVRIATDLDRGNLPLTSALSLLGAMVKGGYVLFGVELKTTNGAEPLVNLHAEIDSTLEEALDSILHQLPGYRYELAPSHIVHIFPTGALQDPDNPLNIRVRELDLKGARPNSLLNHPADYIPELDAFLHPPVPGGPQQSGYAGHGFEANEPKITLSLRDVTVRQVLDAVSASMELFPAPYSPLGWVYSYEPKTSSSPSVHTWAPLSSVPWDWREQAAKERNHK